MGKQDSYKNLWNKVLGATKSKPLIVLIAGGLLVALIFWMFATPELTVPQVELKKERPKIEGVEQAVDPRAIWTESLTQDLKNLKQHIQGLMDAQQQNSKAEIEELKQQINILKQQAETTPSAHVQVIEQKLEPKKKFVHLSQTFESLKTKDPATYVTSGSFARAVLLTGVVADTGTSASGSPQPVLLRLTDHGIFSKGYRTKQIQDAILIGSCHGNISSERAICRLETLSLMNKDGNIVERKVEGWLIGEDGRPGVKGEVIDKSSDVARMAILNGILGGLANFLQNQSSRSVYPVSPITGQAKALGGVDSLKAGAASGVGNALQKLADYAIKRAEQMSPVIVVASGRTIDVVFKTGFILEDEIESKIEAAQTKNSFSNNSFDFANNNIPNQNQTQAFQKFKRQGEY